VRYRRPKPSIVLGTVAAVVVASPVAVLVGGSAPNFAVDPSDPPAITATTINQINLNEVPTIVLNLVKSGLADAGVTLPHQTARHPTPDPARPVAEQPSSVDVGAGHCHDISVCSSANRCLQPAGTCVGR
jgi:hypothetical protein